jgi:hypothetical protein
VAMSCPTFDPRVWQPIPLDIEAPLASVSAASLIYHVCTGSVHSALDLDGGLKYLCGLLSPRFTSYGCLAVVLDSALVYDPEYPGNRFAPKSKALLHIVGGLS